MRFITQKQSDCIESFERAVVAAYKVPMTVLMGRARQDHVASIRHILWRALYDRAGLTTVFLGKRYDRDHTTIYSGIQRAREGYLSSEYELFIGSKTSELGKSLGIRRANRVGKPVEKVGASVNNLTKKR